MKNRLSLTLFSVSFLLFCAPAHSAEKAAEKKSIGTQITNEDNQQFLADRVAFDAFCSVKESYYHPQHENCSMPKQWANSPARWFMDKRTEELYDTIPQCMIGWLFWVEEPLVSTVRTFVRQKGLSHTANILKSACAVAEKYAKKTNVGKWHSSGIALQMLSDDLGR